jgi:hypothetical protein
VRPAEEGEVAHERLGQVALPSVLRDALGAMTFGELLTVRAQDKTEVEELGLPFL